MLSYTSERTLFDLHLLYSTSTISTVPNKYHSSSCASRRGIIATCCGVIAHRRGIIAIRCGVFAHRRVVEARPLAYDVSIV